MEKNIPAKNEDLAAEEVSETESSELLGGTGIEMVVGPSMEE